MPFLRGLVVLALVAGSARGYSVLTHEQIVDQSWKPMIVPMLLERFPSLTAAEMDRAHAFAYGGCAIQDLGYYPFGKHLFSDLTHYVRPGDFVASLFRNARSANELAFAIGALAHYVGDTVGHPRATNLAVGISFPKLRDRYGASVSYEDDKTAHNRVEFAFDINAVTKGRFAPSRYLESIGLEIPRRQLEAAFEETYGFNVWDIIGHRDAALRSYRFGARTFLPSLAYAEAILHRKDFPPDAPGDDLNTYEAWLKQLAADTGWDKYRKKPGLRIHMLAWVIAVLPKVGPIRMLSIAGPNAETEKLYIESVNASTLELNRRLRAHTIVVENRDLDTGKRVLAGTYRLTDDTYAVLLARIVKKPGTAIPMGLKEDILGYYAGGNGSAQVQRELAALAAIETRPEPVQ